MMKKLCTLIFLMMILCPLLLKGESSPPWIKHTYSEDPLNKYYVGISEGAENLNEAMDEAYQNALKEAVRHNFGIKSKFVKSYFNNLEKASIQESGLFESENINLKEIRPVGEYVQKIKGKYLVYRRVSYPIKAIEIEKKRLALNKAGPLNEYSLKGKTLGSLLIKTNPTGTDLVLTSTKGTGEVHGSGSARFHVPLGEYNLTIVKEGFEPIEEMVIVTGDNSEVGFQLKPSTGSIEIDFSPKDSTIYLNNQKVKNNSTYEVQVGKEYIVRAEHPDFRPFLESVSPWVHQKIGVGKDLVPKKASLTVISQPAGAHLYVENQFMGKTPMNNLKLYPGTKMSVRISKSGFSSESQFINLKANKAHKPIVVVLKVEKKRKPSSKVFSKTNLFKTASRDSRFSIAYQPVVSNEEKTKFYLLPIGINFFKYSRLSFGADYRYTFDERSSPTGKFIEDIDQEWSGNILFYPIRNRSFSFALGPEYNFQKNTIKNHKYSSRTSSVAYKQETGREALGFKALAVLHLSQKVGISTDYRQFSASDSEKRSISFGLMFDF